MKKLVILFLIVLIVFNYGCVKPSPEINEEIKEEPKDAVSKTPPAP